MVFFITISTWSSIWWWHHIFLTGFLIGCFTFTEMYFRHAELDLTSNFDCHMNEIIGLSIWQLLLQCSKEMLKKALDRGDRGRWVSRRIDGSILSWIWRESDGHHKVVMADSGNSCNGGVLFNDNIQHHRQKCCTFNRPSQRMAKFRLLVHTLRKCKSLFSVQVLPWGMGLLFCFGPQFCWRRLSALLINALWKG